MRITRFVTSSILNFQLNFERSIPSMLVRCTGALDLIGTSRFVKNVLMNKFLTAQWGGEGGGEGYLPD